MSCLPFKCLYPRRIKVNDDYIHVPCGHCEACTVQSALRRKSLIQVESLDYKYCMFVTLTYSEDNVPVMRLSKDDDLHRSYFFDVTSRKRYRSPVCFGEPLFSLPYCDFYPTSRSLKSLSEKIRRPRGEFMFLNYHDCQSFIKRIRRRISYYLNDYTNDNKIRYFYVGEYSPIHFRPHFHLLFFFNSDAVFRVFSELVSSCWKYGISRTELSKGGCASYVSSYLNGFSSLPSLFAQSPIRQKSVHSIRFGEQLFKTSYEEIGKIDDSLFTRRSCPELGLTGEFSAPLSLERRLYPKCQGFVSFNKGELLLSYCSYFSAVEQYRYTKCPPETIDDYAKALCEDYTSPLTLSFRRLYGDDIYYNPEKLSRILRTSALFLNNCTLYDITPYDYVDAIISYYGKKELHKLSQFYSEQDEFIQTWCTSDVSNYKFLNLFYDESLHAPSSYIEDMSPVSLFQSSISFGTTEKCFIHWSNSPMRYDYQSRMVGCIDRMTKHKLINDFNKIFTNSLNYTYGKKCYEFGKYQE